MSIIIMLILLSILILVHEAGHFIAAKCFGMKVEKFGFGLPIGPTLFETKWGDTKILIHAFLLGGYIAFPDDEKDCELDKDSPERFLNRPIYQRAIVVSAGVFANVVCAFFFVFLTAFMWGNLPSGNYELYINEITAPKTEAIWDSGIQKGDRIYKINETPINHMHALLTYVQNSKHNDGKITDAMAVENYRKLKELNPIFKDNEIISKDLVVRLPKKSYEETYKFDKMTLNGVKKIESTQIQLDDRLIQLRDKLENNKGIFISDGNYSLRDISQAYSDGIHPLYIEVIRNGKHIKLAPTYPNNKGLLGIKLEVKEILTPTKTPKTVLKTGTKYLYDNTYMMVYGLYQIFTGKVPLKDLHGIVAITKVGGDIIDNSGIYLGLLLTAIISMDLAIVNFLPIPALDGGHIMFLIIEKIRRKPLEEEIVNKIGSIGFAFLIILMIFIVFNDIFALVTQKL